MPNSRGNYGNDIAGQIGTGANAQLDATSWSPDIMQQMRGLTSGSSNFNAGNVYGGTAHDAAGNNNIPIPPMPDVPP
jgi:hypothetical protein